MRLLQFYSVCVCVCVCVRACVRACVGTIYLTIINMFACTRFHLISSKPAARLLCRLSSWWVKKNVVQHNTITRVCNCTPPHTTRRQVGPHVSLGLCPKPSIPFWPPARLAPLALPAALVAMGYLFLACSICNVRAFRWRYKQSPILLYCASPTQTPEDVWVCSLSRFVLSALSVLVNSLSGYWHNFLVNWCT